MEKQKKPQLFILLLLVSFASVGAVLYSPGLPMLAKHFQISATQAQRTVSIYLIGYALGQLPYGPIANRFGRKPTLYMGVLLQIIAASTVTAFGYTSMYIPFLIAVFFMALGASVGLKMTFNLIGDAFSQKEATKRIAYLGLSFAITPGIGVALGGFIIKYFTWQSCFLFLVLYGLSFLCLIPFLPETLKVKDMQALQVKKVIKGFLNEFCNAPLILCSLLWGLGTSMIYLFAQIAPFIGIEMIGLKPATYGLYNFIPPIGLILGSFTARFLVGKTNIFNIILAGIFLGTIGVLSQLFSFLNHFINPMSLFLPMILIYFGIALVFTNVSALALEKARDKSNASSVINFVNMSTALIATLISGFISGMSVLVMPILYLAICLVMWLSFYLLRRVTWI